MNFKKVLLWSAVVLVALCVVAVVLIKLLLSPAAIAAQITPRIESIFEQPVQIGNSELTIFSGVGLRVHDIKVLNPPPFTGQPLASATSIDAKVKLLPLLVGSVRLKEISIQGGQVYLAKDSVGTNNFGALSLDRVRQAVRGRTDDELFCRQVSLRNARLLYRNDSTGNRLVLGNVNADLEVGSGSEPSIAGDVSIDSLFSWSPLGNFLMSSSAAEVSWSGNYSLTSDSLVINRCDWRIDKIRGRLDGAVAKPTSQPYLNVHVISEHTNLADCGDSRIVAAYPFLRGMILGGDLRIDINLRGDISDTKTTTVRGKITWTDATAKLPDTDVNLKARLVESDFNEQSLSFFTEEAAIGAAPALLRLAIDNYREPTFSGEMRIACDARVLGQLLRVDKDVHLAGDVTTSLSGFVKSSDREQSRFYGNLSLANLSYEDASGAPAINPLNVDLNLSGNDAELSRFDVSVGGNALQLTGKITDFAQYLATKGQPHKRPRFDFTAGADTLDLAILSGGYGGAGDTTSLLHLLDYFFDFDSRGTLQIDSLSAGGVSLMNLRSNVTVVNRIMYSDSVACVVFDKPGMFDVVIDMNDLSTPEFEVEYAETDLEINDFLSGLTHFQNHLYGRADLEFALKGRGLTSSEVLPTLWAAGKAKLEDGKIVGISALNVLANQYGIESLKHDEFDELQASFQLENRSLRLAPLNIKSGKLVYQVEGAVDLNGEFDCRVTRTLSKDDAKTLVESPEAAGLAGNRSVGKAVFHVTGGADTAYIKLDALLPKD